MKLTDLATASALAAEHATLTTLTSAQDVTVEVNVLARHRLTFDAATASGIIATRIAAIEAQLTTLGVTP